MPQTEGNLRSSHCFRLGLTLSRDVCGGDSGVSVDKAERLSVLWGNDLAVNDIPFACSGFAKNEAVS